MYVKAYAERSNHTLLHSLWTKAVGTKDYDKEEWITLEQEWMELEHRLSAMKQTIDQLKKNLDAACLGWA